jgi:hypothetical protein
MLSRKVFLFLCSLAALLSYPLPTIAQTQTTCRIAGTVRDPNGAAIVGAEITVVSKATGERRKVTADREGNYALSFLSPGTYEVKAMAPGFNSALFDNVQVLITETTLVNASLVVAGVVADPVVVRIAPLIQRDGPQLGRVVDSRAVSELPLATCNFTQILGLSPGTSVDLADNTTLGRNSQNVSVNGARDAEQLPNQTAWTRTT